MRKDRLKTQRVVAELTREQMDILDKIGKDALYSTGYKLPRGRVIAALIDVIIELGIDGRDIKDEPMLKRRIMQGLIHKLEANPRQPRDIKEAATPREILSVEEIQKSGCTEHSKNKAVKKGGLK